MMAMKELHERHITNNLKEEFRNVLNEFDTSKIPFVISSYN